MKSARRFARLAVALCALAVPRLAFGWGTDGHQITCLIAEDHLTPAAKAAIHELLGANVNISDAEIANWADQIRRDETESSPWHFVDIPISAAAFDEARDGKDGQNVIDKTTYFAKRVADQSLSKSERAEALKYLVHFVGDLHQPLHCATRNDDHGGNTRLVFFPQIRKAVSLHQVWDSKILIAMRGNTPIAKYADALDAKFKPADIEKWQKGTPTDWANQSHDLAANVVYAGIPESGPPPRLDTQYLQAARPVIETQLEKGGVRLAMILNQVLVPKR